MTKTLAISGCGICWAPPDDRWALPVISEDYRGWVLQSIPSDSRAAGCGVLSKIEVLKMEVRIGLKDSTE